MFSVFFSFTHVVVRSYLDLDGGAIASTDEETSLIEINPNNTSRSKSWSSQGPSSSTSEGYLTLLRREIHDSVLVQIWHMKSSLPEGIWS